MTYFSFFVRGIPKAQPRARHARRGRFSVTYNPDTADDWKSLVMIKAKKHFTQPIDGPVSVSIQFIFPRPKSHYNSKGVIKPNAPHWHTSKPDRDNLDKCVLDALTSIGAFGDDAQVCDGLITKKYCHQGGKIGAWINVTKLEP